MILIQRSLCHSGLVVALDTAVSVVIGNDTDLEVTVSPKVRCCHGYCRECFYSQGY